MHVGALLIVQSTLDKSIVVTIQDRLVFILLLLLLAIFLHPSFKSMNGMGVDKESKHRLMRDLVTMMVITFSIY